MQEMVREAIQAEGMMEMGDESDMDTDSDDDPFGLVLPKEPLGRSKGAILEEMRRAIDGSSSSGSGGYSGSSKSGGYGGYGNAANVEQGPWMNQEA